MGSTPIPASKISKKLYVFVISIIFIYNKVGYNKLLYAILKDIYQKRRSVSVRLRLIHNVIVG